MPRLFDVLYYSDEIKIERWSGEDVVCLTVKSGDKIFKFVVPNFAVNKLLNKANNLMDDKNE